MIQIFEKYSSTLSLTLSASKTIVHLSSLEQYVINIARKADRHVEIIKFDLIFILKHCSNGEDTWSRDKGGDCAELGGKYQNYASY